MTCPYSSLQLTASLANGKTLFRSWLLLFGILPIEYDLISIDECTDGTSFVENSSMGLMSVWRHARTLHTTNQGTLITDELTFCPRIPFSGWFLSLIVRLLFRYRHHRLGQLYHSLSSTCVTLH